MKVSKLILPIIVFAQFCCTSLWFAGNGIMSELMVNFHLSESSLGHLTSAVQLGFIFGTLLFAVLTIADRYSPSKVFFICALFGALFNLGILWETNNLETILIFRFLTGFFLAGIYPVGMKIAADYYKKGLGKSLGFLVGALVLGTAFPHLLRQLTGAFSWKTVVQSTSLLAVFGGASMILLVPDGPFRKESQKLDISAFFRVFRVTNFRAGAFGYFGHMWELYAFWAFVPIMLKTYQDKHLETVFNIPILSFLIIGIGAVSCVLGGYISQKAGSKKTAFMALFLSCICCLASPWIFDLTSSFLFIGFLVFWGMVVIADSPLFSTIVAQSAAESTKGTALTIVNCIGFGISIISIQVITILSENINSNAIYSLLALGPILGLIGLGWKTKKT